MRVELLKDIYLHTLFMAAKKKAVKKAKKAKKRK